MIESLGHATAGGGTGGGGGGGVSSDSGRGGSVLVGSDATGRRRGGIVGGISQGELEFRARREYLLIKQEILQQQQRELQQEWAEAKARFGCKMNGGAPEFNLQGKRM